MPALPSRIHLKSSAIVDRLADPRRRAHGETRSIASNDLVYRRRLREPEEMKHVVFVATSHYAHNIGLACLAANLARRSSDLWISYFAPECTKDQMTRLLSRDFKLTPDVQERIRLVFLHPRLLRTEVDPVAGLYSWVAQVVIDRYYDTLMSVPSARQDSLIPPPTAFVCDALAHPLADHARQRGFTGPTILWIMWEPSAGAVYTENLRLGIDTVAQQLIDVEGLPKRFNYEMKPCTVPIVADEDPCSVHPLWQEYYKSAVSGQHRLVWGFSRVLNAPGIGILEAYDLKRPVTVVGAPFEPSFFDKRPTFPKGEPLFDWLDQQAPNSVAFVTFGSIWFPASSPWQLEVLVDALCAAGLRCVLLTGPVTARMVADTALLDRIKDKVSSCKGMHCGWINQRLAIRHSSIGLVVHHGGAGTTIETLVAGHPSIVWPFGWDQVATATTIADSLDAGWELYEHRDKLVGREIASKPGYRVKCTPSSLRQELDAILADFKGAGGERRREAAQWAARILRDENFSLGGSYLDEMLKML